MKIFGRHLRLTAVLSLALLIVVGCSEEPEEDRNNIIFPNNGGMEDMGVPDQGIDMAVAPDAGAPDAEMGLPMTDGFMTGKWVIRHANTDEDQATLILSHKAGSEEVTGTYRLADGTGPMPGTIDNATWRNDQFRASWSFPIDGVVQEFLVANAVKQADDLILARYTDPREVMPFDVQIVRVAGGP